jgi:photosystem II stability/assembly factor-like uncharacterized protein
MRRMNTRFRYRGLWISVVLAISATSLSSVAYAGLGVWTSGGPYGGDVHALAINPTTPATLYAGTFGFGVFKSTNSGGTWASANTGLTNLSVNALAINPTTPATLYAGTPGGGVFKSTDSGGTWAAANTGLTNLNVWALAINPTTPATLYAGTNGGGVFKSTDSGGTWAAANTGLTNRTVLALAINSTTPATLYAGPNGGGVFKSTDSGGTWAPANTGLTYLYVSALAINPTTPATLYAGTLDGGVFKSTDSGGTWAAANTGLTNLTISALAINPTTPATLYAGTIGVGVFMSTDSGDTWAAANTGLANTWTVQALALDPTGATTLYAGFLNAGVWQLTPSDASLLLSHERVGVTVDWRSQYSGQSGTAHAIPQKDEFGYFYFTDPSNPEVIVKVLDFGGGGALCFVGGLSDFYYKVTFTTLQTGQSLVFEKPAGAYVGFADNGKLRFGRPGDAAAEAPPQIAPGAAFSYAGFLPFGSEGRAIAARRPAQALATTLESLTLSQGRVQVIVEWRSQYSGQSGVAYAIPQQDGFGFFYFSDANNPEVFVKVLDFGGGGALCFVGGLSDFYYKVTFETLRTGQTLVFEKAAGLYLGFADNGGLRF